MKDMKSNIKISILVLLFVFVLVSCGILPGPVIQIRGTTYFDTIRNVENNIWDLKIWTQVSSGGYNFSSEYTFNNPQITINLILREPSPGSIVTTDTPIMEITQSLDILEGNYSLYFTNEGRTDNYNISITSYNVMISTVGTPVFTCPADYESIQF